MHAITVLLSGFYSFYSVILCERSVLKISAFDFTVESLPLRLRYCRLLYNYATPAAKSVYF